MAGEILLESGTNEVEILEFFLRGHSMGINVAKISQIVPFEAKRLTRIPDGDSAILGTLLWQNKTISLIDLDSVLYKSGGKGESEIRQIVLVTEFNNVINGFLCDGVNRIHRINWGDIAPLSGFLENFSSMVTGSVNLDDRDILMVDFEYIISELYPETKMGYGDGKIQEVAAIPSREKMKIVFAEDSPFIRSTIIGLLKDVGYSNIASYENGNDAFSYIQESVKKPRKRVGKFQSSST